MDNKSAFITPKIGKPIKKIEKNGSVAYNYIQEIVMSSKKSTITVKSEDLNKTRNPVARAVCQKSGAGAHPDRRKKLQTRKIKHKNKEV